MNFLNKIHRSVYSPEFYSKIAKQSFGSALSYFLILSLLLTIITAAFPIFSFLTGGRNEIQTFANQIKNIYPSELEIKVKNGNVTTNVEEPYFIPIPSDDKSASAEGNLAVIDTKTPFSAKQFNEYRTFVWVTKDTLIMKADEDSAQLRSFDLSEVSDVTLNKNSVNTFIAKFTPWLNLVYPVVVILILIGVFMLYASRLVYLLLLSVLIMLLLKLIKRPLKYADAYKTGLYAMTLGLLIETAVNLLRLQSFPFMLSFITLAVVYFNFQSAKKSPKSKK
jgi:hypothetical protein